MPQLYRYASLTVLAAALLASVWSPRASARHATALPDTISNHEFWRLTEELSEPGGSFRSDNLLSNEVVFARVLPELAPVKRGGVYLGVGPEQNFTYMAATRPRIAFILDIRRGNLHTQLMYKALFELSADRAEFVSKLFTKPRPEGLGDSSSAADVMNAYWTRPSGDAAAFERNFQAIVRVLTGKYQLPLSTDDLEGINQVYHAFYWFGPGITWSSTASGTSGGRATYRDLMTQTDEHGGFLSYLASEDRFRYLKDMQRRNLVIPVVGNFAGDRALRAIGDFVRRRSATVSVFYLSNVEQYLRQDGLWNHFCDNVASLPLDASSVFIRPSGVRIRMTPGTPAQVQSGYAASPVMAMLPEAKSCGAAPRIGGF
jgi:hypothetical protein